MCIRYGNEAVHRAKACVGEQAESEGQAVGQCNNVVNSSNYTRSEGESGEAAEPVLW